MATTLRPYDPETDYQFVLAAAKEHGGKSVYGTHKDLPLFGIQHPHTSSPAFGRFSRDVLKAWKECEYLDTDRWMRGS